MTTRRSPDSLIPSDSPASATARASRRPRARTLPEAAPAPAPITPEARHALIAESAYLRAERRGFAPGHETDDWLAAEAEVDALLRAEHGRPAP